MESGLIKQSYTANDIVSLSAGKAFRQKIGMYLSADRQEAINLGLRELIVNVQDEYEVYKPKNPYMKICLNTKDRIISVEDNMRGIPVGIREDGINSLTATFLIPHSGGKHQEGVYSSAVGINGEGNKIVCHTADWLNVKVWRDGKIYTQSFKSDAEGATAIEDVKEQPGSEKTGTYIEYKPAAAVYGDVFIDIEALRQSLKEMSMFSTGLAIELKIGEFEAEYAGKMQLYLTALDEQVKLPDENPSIGIIICKSKDKTYVEYALKQTIAPIGVATYQLRNTLPEDMKAMLPEPEEIVKRLKIFKEI